MNAVAIEVKEYIMKADHFIEQGEPIAAKWLLHNIAKELKVWRQVVMDKCETLGFAKPID